MSSFDAYADTKKYPIDLRQILNLVVPKLPDKWREIGLMLNFTNSELNAIKQKISLGGDPYKFFTELMVIWERGSHTPFNWYELLNALSCEIVGENRFANELARTLNSNSEGKHESQTDSIKKPVKGEEAVDQGQELPKARLPPTLDIEEDIIHEYKVFSDDLVHDINIIIMTATKIEFQAVMKVTKPLEKESHVLETVYRPDNFKSITLFIGMCGLCKVAIVKSGKGAKSAKNNLELAQKAIKAYFVISVGICYGLKKLKSNIGDIIVPEKIFDISSKRKCGADSYINLDQYTCGSQLVDIFDQWHGFKAPEKYTIEIHTRATTVTESVLVDDKKYKEETLQQLPNALGGEMEAGGIMEVAKQENFEAIVIKAIADWGENKEESKKHQPFAALAAASYVHFQLNKSHAPDRLKKHQTCMTDGVKNNLIEL